MELDWQHKLHDVKQRGLHMLSMEKWADCRFLVGVASPNQKMIAAHKIMLASSSPVFETMFFGSIPDKGEPILIPDVQPDIFEAMLQYIYSDNTTISSFDKAFKLGSVAKKYMLPDLLELCVQFMIPKLSPENACRAYEFAKFFDVSRLKAKSMELIVVHTREVLADPSFMEIEMSTFMDILDQKKLNIDSELDLFNALLKFVSSRRMCKDRSINVESHSKQNGNGVDNLLSIEKNEVEPDVHAMNAECSAIDEEMIRKAVKKIRFLTMTSKEFVEGPVRSNLLQHHEALAIITKICSPLIKDYPMPEGFCMDSCKRIGLNCGMDNDKRIFFHNCNVIHRSILSRNSVDRNVINSDN